MIRSALLVVLTTLVYTLVIGSFAPWDIFLGALLAIGLRWTLRRRLPNPPVPPPPITLRQMAAFWPFVGAVVWEILVGTLLVVRITLHLKPIPRAGILAVPIGDRTPLGIAVSALTTNLSPGTVMLDVDEDRKVMVIHAIDATDPEAIRATFQRLYERYQRAVFP